MSDKGLAHRVALILQSVFLVRSRDPHIRRQGRQGVYQYCGMPRSLNNQVNGDRGYGWTEERAGGTHLRHSRGTLEPMTSTSVIFHDRVKGGITDQSDIACTDVQSQARGTVRCSAIRVKGQLHATKNFSRGGLPHLVQSLLHTRWRHGMD